MQQTSKEIEIGCDNSIPISTSCNPVFAMNNRNSISTALQFDISPLAAASFVDVSRAPSVSVSFLRIPYSIARGADQR